MQERMCQYQQTMLETTLNVHASRCVNRKSSNYCGPVHRDLCQGCPDRKRVLDDDKLARSLADSVYVAMERRSPELVDDLMASHCRPCEHYRPQTGMCANIQCEHYIPIRDLMKNPKTHCAKGVW